MAGEARSGRNAAGASTVDASSSPARCLSTAALLSKCGMPVPSSALATEEYATWETRASYAASIRATDCRVSDSGSVPNGVPMTKAASAPAAARRRESGSSKSPPTGSAPSASSAFADAELGFLVRARTRCPRSSRARATAPPWLPVAPDTSAVSEVDMSTPYD